MTGADGELAPAVLSAPGQAEIRQQAVAAAGATVVQVGGDLYVSDEALAAFWQPTETTPLECPYPGLEAFGLAQAKWFFGRERLTGDLIDLLDRALRRGNGGPIVVVGPSGAGKSSLLGAGLLKAVRDGRLPAAGSADWPVLKLTPGATPMRTLAVAAHQCAAAIRDSTRPPMPHRRGMRRSRCSGMRSAAQAVSPSAWETAPRGGCSWWRISSRNCSPPEAVRRK